jgi:predicted RNase H-like nuclease (RuvC/YqgF family)
VSTVSIQEAAVRLGVSIETIRRRIHNGQLSASQSPTPQGFVWLVELPNNEDEVSPPSENGQVLRELVASLQAQVEAQQKQMDQQLAAYQEQLQAKDKQLETRAREIQELHVLLQQAQKALPAPKADRQSWWQRLWQRQR